jgi:hypothetical protein
MEPVDLLCLRNARSLLARAEIMSKALQTVTFYFSNRFAHEIT